MTIDSSNEHLFKDLLRNVRPDVFVLMDVLDTYQMNVFVVIKIMRALMTLDNGTGWGRIQIIVQEGKVKTIEVIETDMVNEHILKVSQDDPVNKGSVRNTANDHFSSKNLEELAKQ